MPLPARKPDATDTVARLAADPVRLHSAMSQWETVAALCKSPRVSVSDARFRVDTFSSEFGFGLVEIGGQEARIAADAFEHDGKGRHPASLNMGDCFA